MFLSPYVPKERRRRFDHRVMNIETKLSTGNEMQLFVCSYGFANLAYQVVAYKVLSSRNFVPLPGFDHLAIPFWPNLPIDYVWPGNAGLRSHDEFRGFHERWQSVASI